MPGPAWLDAQGVTSSRRRRLGGVPPRVVCGTQLAIAQVWAREGWPITPAVIERLNLASRQGVSAVGRRGTTLGQGATGGREQGVVVQGEHHCVFPHARWRQPLRSPAGTSGRGARKGWRPGTPAMAAG